jgi:hypothetical protein
MRKSPKTKGFWVRLAKRRIPPVHKQDIQIRILPITWKAIGKKQRASPRRTRIPPRMRKRKGFVFIIRW